MELLLILIAPVLQIIFSVLRVKGKITLPVGVIAVVAIIAGCSLSILAGNILMDGLIDRSPKGSVNCGMPFAACFILGTFVDTIAAIIIGGIAAIAYYNAAKNRRIAVEAM